jgi:hypothetical protein
LQINSPSHNAPVAARPRPWAVVSYITTGHCGRAPIACGVPAWAAAPGSTQDFADFAGPRGSGRRRIPLGLVAVALRSGRRCRGFLSRWPPCNAHEGRHKAMVERPTREQMLKTLVWHLVCGATGRPLIWLCQGASRGHSSHCLLLWHARSHALAVACPPWGIWHGGWSATTVGTQNWKSSWFPPSQLVWPY